MRKYIIYGTPRSGTTLLVSLLDSHPDVLCIGEALKKNSRNITHAELSYDSFMNDKFSRKFMHYYARSTLMENYLNYIYGLKSYEAIGFKFHHIHKERFPAVMSYLSDNNVSVIRIIRVNLLKKYVSLLTAIKRKLYASKENVDIVQVNINPNAIIRELEALEREEVEIEKNINGVRCMEIKYEELCYNMRDVTTPVLDFLGVDSSIDLKTPIRKMNPDNLEELIENYDEISNVIKNTRFSEYLPS